MIQILNQFQPYFDEKYKKTVNSNYEFTIKDFEPISALMGLLGVYPLPKSKNGINYIKAYHK